MRKTFYLFLSILMPVVSDAFSNSITLNCNSNNEREIYSMFASNIHSTESQLDLITVGPSQDTLTKEDFKRVINQQFGYILTGQAKNVVGNFASLDLGESEVNFAGSILTKNGSVIGAKLSGGVSDGLFEIFNKTKLNSKVGIQLQYHFLTLGKKFVEYEFQSGEAYQNKINVIRHKSAESIREIIGGKPMNDLIIKKSDIMKKKDKLIVEKDSILAAVRNPTSESVARVSNALLGIAAFDLQIDSIDQVMDNQPTAVRLVEEENNRRAVDLKALRLQPDLQISGFSFGWSSISYKVKKNDFTLFDQSLAFDLQKVDTSFVTHELSFQQSHYKWSSFPYESFYITGGLGVTYTDNFATDLKKVEITEETEYGPTTGARTVTKKYNAYTGDYKSRVAGLRFFLEYYRFLFNGNTGAIHIYPEVLFQQHSKPRYNFGLGFLFPFRDTKDETSIVNAELYFNILDMFDGASSKETLFKRNSIGIRLAFPINFKYQKLEKNG